MSALESLFASMTLAELARIAGTTISGIVEVAYSGRPAASSSSSQTRTEPSKLGKVARGGLAADQVLAALRAVGAAAKLEDVRAKTGGSVQQVRAALQRLAGAKKVKITGQRRGTRYTAG